MRAPPSALVVLVLAFVLTLGLGFLLKDQCAGAVSWGGEQYRTGCYNDILPIYFFRHFDNDTVPYREYPPEAPGEDPDPEEPRGFLEYPVLTGALLYASAMLGTWRSAAFGGIENHVEFFYWNVLFLGAFAAGSLWLLVRLVPQRPRLAYFAAGGPLVLYAFHNWDLMAIFFTLLGLWWFERGRHGLSGAAFALGAASKLYPILFPPLLFMMLLRRRFDAEPGTAIERLSGALRRARPAWVLAASTGGTFALVHLLVLPFTSPRLLLETYLFHAGRLPNAETTWFALHQLGKAMGTTLAPDPGRLGWLQPAALVLFLLAYAGLAVAAWLRMGPRASILCATLLFLLLNKIFSVQYALWVLPMFALLPLPAWTFGLYAFADSTVYFLLFPTFYRVDTSPLPFERVYLPVGFAVLLRTLALAILMAYTLRRSLRGGSDPRAAPDGFMTSPPLEARP